MQRVLVIGGNGAGKTTFARELSQRTGLPLTHLDTLYWRDNWQSAPDAEFDVLLLAALEKPRWIIDGNISRTLKKRLEYCDTVIYFDFPRLPCLIGAIKRELLYHGKSRHDMGGYCPERLNIAFLKNVWNFRRKNRANYLAAINVAPDVKLITVTSRAQARRLLKGL